MSRLQQTKAETNIYATNPEGQEQRIAGNCAHTIDAVWGGYLRCHKITPLFHSADGAKAVVLVGDYDKRGHVSEVRTKETVDELMALLRQADKAPVNLGPGPRISRNPFRILAEAAGWSPNRN